MKKIMDDFNHKTIFVLDHTQYFGISGDNGFELDSINNRDINPPLSISKSLWTTSVENSIEYCRIVWDLFPTGKLIRFVVSDSNAHIVNTWTPTTQNLTHVMNAMAMVGIPPSTPITSDYSVIHGLRAAVEALAEPTENQKEAIAAKEKLMNQGRVICITSARDDASMKSLEDIFSTVITQQNMATISNNQNYLQIDRCHLVIVNLYPSLIESMVNNKPLQEISTCLKTEVHSVKARDFAKKLTHLIMPHYDLASTTVTGIPMKEEQNASSSANYDVEIFHSKNAHSVILDTELTLPTSIKQGSEYETVTLKWCTPRGLGASDMQPCLAQNRITPVDVTSRPSSCLINFLLNGRSVLLEMPRKTGGKLTSHLLSAHGGEIFIHTLHISRSCLDDLPSILEGVGGGVTDYRINDYAALIQKYKLVPLKPVPERTPDRNLARLRAKFDEYTKYWPLTVRSTLVHNIRQFIEPLLNITTKEELTEDEVLKCRQSIFNLISFERRHEPLTLPVGHKLKGNKKDEQYKLVWAELELILENGPKSPGHKVILKCVKDYRSDSDPSDKSDLDRMNSPMSPPSSSELKNLNKSKSGYLLSTTAGRTLFDLKVAADQAACQKRMEFSGRLCTPPGQIAKLYPNLKLNEEGTSIPRDIDMNIK